MEQERGGWAVLLRGVLCALASAVVAGSVHASGGRAVDVALWAVLAPLLAAAALELAPRASRRLSGLHRQRAPGVVPDAVARGRTAPDTAVAARQAAVEQVRAALLAARERGAPVSELLGLARALHEARLDVARATLSAGGHVPQELRDELALRDRTPPSPAEVRQG